MAGFDLSLFNRINGTTGATTLESLGMSFGIPGCLLGLGQNVLSLLPSPTLGDITREISGAKSMANEITADFTRGLFLWTGIVEFDTETGTFKFMSDSSKMKMDEDSTNALDAINAVIDVAQYGYDFGAQIYQNLAAGAAQLQAITDCVGKLADIKAFSGGEAARQRANLSPAEQEELISAEFAAGLQQVAFAKSFIRQADEQIINIGRVMRDRAEDPSLEPVYADLEEIRNVVGPYFNVGAVEDPTVEEEDAVFRLTYGPPITTDGQYILTEDGLYYDSRSGGLDPVFLSISGTVPVGDRWRYEYDPNLGGKGDAISIDSLNKFKDNMFDPENIDDSLGLQEYYNQDHFLATVQQQRDKFVYDLSSDLVKYVDDFGESSPIVKNQRQLIISEINNHDFKIARRKKQIEVAVKAPQVYGGLTEPIFAPGEIPINDFSYLEEYNLEVDLEKQRALVFDQGEVEGIVLPINPSFVRAAPRPRSLGYDHLHVPNVGKGSIIYTPEDPSGTVLSLTDNIVTDGLFGIYNFLSTDIVSPSSLEYKVTNCATEDIYNNAQLIASNRSEVFASGLAIPYLGGLAKKSGGDINSLSAVGSVVRLPDTDEYRNLTYSTEGFTTDFWVHVPDVADPDTWIDTGASSLTRCILASENTGKLDSALALSSDGNLLDLDYIQNDRGESFTRGMIMGITRDRRISEEDLPHSNLDADNQQVSFFIAPTQARDASSLSWINKDRCSDGTNYFKMVVPIADMGSVESEFVQCTVTCDPSKNEISIFSDGSLVTTSAISDVFGTEERQPPSLPSFTKENSFEYSPELVDGVIQLKEGPKLNEFFTPWIVGGGYTDGMYTNGFMGGDRGGYQSGLGGHVGSMKFYSRPLTAKEVEQNYEAQQGLFKSILV